MWNVLLFNSLVEGVIVLKNANRKKIGSNVFSRNWYCILEQICLYIYTHIQNRILFLTYFVFRSSNIHFNTYSIVYQYCFCNT